MKRLGALVLLGSMAVAAEPARGEEIAAGTRVRVKGRGDLGSLTGSLVSIDERGVTLLEGGGGRRVMALRDVAGIAVSQKRGRRGKYALVGMTVGAVAGFAVGAVTNGDGCQPSPDNFCFFGPGPLFSDEESGALLAVPLAAIGAGIGALSGGEKWRGTGDPRLAVSVTARPGRLAAALTVRTR